MKTRKIDKITMELQTKLDKQFGEYGEILVRNDGNCLIEVIFEENYFLYDALNCYVLAFNVEVENFFDKILQKYDTYMELYNSCIGHIFVE